MICVLCLNSSINFRASEVLACGRAVPCEAEAAAFSAELGHTAICPNQGEALKFLPEPHLGLIVRTHVCVCAHFFFPKWFFQQVKFCSWV